MTHFLIAYDLHNRRDYPPLWDALQSWGAVRLLESLWLLNSANDALSLRRAVESVIDSDDSVVVIELKEGSSWATIRTYQPGIDWLSQNIASLTLAA